MSKLFSLRTIGVLACLSLILMLVLADSILSQLKDVKQAEVSPFYRALPYQSVAELSEPMDIQAACGFKILQDTGNHLQGDLY